MRPTWGGVNVSATARRIYEATKCNAAAVAQIRAEHLELALALATDPDAAFDLTSSTTNGQTFSGKRNGTSEDRLALLDEVVWCYDNESAVPRTTRLLF